jgi:hypothetical protein
MPCSCAYAIASATVVRFASNDSRSASVLRFSISTPSGAPRSSGIA